MKKAVFIVTLLISFKMICYANAFECDSVPFEGIPFFRVEADTLTLHQKPFSASPAIINVKIAKGSIISLKDTYAELIRQRNKYGDGPYIKSTDVINTKITLEKSIQRVVKPGIIKATGSGTLKEVVQYGPIKSCADIDKNEYESISELTFKYDDVIEDLLYLGEGQCMMRFHGQVFLSDTCLGNVNSLARMSWPESEWWVTINENKKELGWFKMTKKNGFLQLLGTVH